MFWSDTVGCERCTESLERSSHSKRILERGPDENIQIVGGANVSVQDDGPSTHDQKFSVGFSKFVDEIGEILRELSHGEFPI